MTKKNSTSKFYPIENDWKLLPEKTRGKIQEGVKLCGEPVLKFYGAEETIEYIETITD